MKSGINVTSTFSGMATESQCCRQLEESLLCRSLLGHSNGFNCALACDCDETARTAILHQQKDKFQPSCLQCNVLDRLSSESRSQIEDIALQQHIRLRDLKHTIFKNNAEKKEAMTNLGIQFTENLHRVLQGATWATTVLCQQHGKSCPMPQMNPECIWMEVGGSCCWDYSNRGNRDMVCGQSVVYLLTWLYWIKKFGPDLVWHECTAKFSDGIIVRVLSEEYFVETVVDSPDDCDLPTRRVRKWTLCRSKARLHRLRYYDATSYGGLFWKELSRNLNDHCLLPDDVVDELTMKRAIALNMPSMAPCGRRWHGSLVLGYTQRRMLRPYCEIAECQGLSDEEPTLVDLSQNGESTHRVMQDTIFFTMCRNSVPYHINFERLVEPMVRVSAMGHPVFSAHFTWNLEHAMERDFFADRQWQGYIGNAMHSAHLGQKIMYSLSTSLLKQWVPSDLAALCTMPLHDDISDISLETNGSGASSDSSSGSSSD